MVNIMALSNNERVMKKIQERFNLGALRYQTEIPINTGRDYMKESLEEILDLIIYLATKLIEMDSNQDPDPEEKGIFIDCRSEEEKEENPVEW
jgi:hypothetical protein